MWIDQVINDNKIREISIVYHKAVKKLAGLAPWDSNHEACNTVGVNIFKHLMVKRMLNYFKDLVKTENKIFSTLRYFIACFSKTRRSLEYLLRNWYNVENFMTNDYAAIKARIDFVERNEPRSYYNCVT